MSLIKKGKKLAHIMREGSYRRALRMGVAAAVEHESVLRHMNCQTVVDIGANRGQFALVAQKHFPTARIFSFEPLQGPAQKFRTLFSDEPRTTLHECAIAPCSGHAEIHVSGHDDSSSLLPITELQNTLHPGTSEVATQRVAVRTLDSVLKPEDIVEPALLKMDVQGFELDCLRGCERLLPKFRYLLVECSFQELYSGQAMAGQVIGFLHQQGFDLTGIFHLGYDQVGRSVDGDFLFEPRSKACSSVVVAPQFR